MTFILQFHPNEESVFSKSSCLIATVALALSILCCAAIPAQSTTSSASQSAPVSTAPEGAASSSPAPDATGTLRGHVLDPTGALIPGAQITVTTTKGGAVGTATANAAGAYALHGLAAGSYIVQVTSAGFAPFVSAPIAISAGQTKSIDVKMAVEAAEQQVVVSEEGGPSVSTEAGANTSALVLKGSDLDALSDDPDELSNELTALAGPSAGPNGGQIYIDGFTGGQLPPKSAIREIRINQNPFSAEFDRIGYGRIEVLTKPGTDTLHGRFFGQGNSDVFNTGNPFTKELPSYYSDQFNGTVSGSIKKQKASYFLSIEDRETQTDDVYSIPGGPVYDAGTNTWSISATPVSGSLFSPANHLEVSPRIDLQLGPKNTLTMRYQFHRNRTVNDLSNSTNLPSQAESDETIEHTVQIDDTQLLSDRLVNETRFEYRRGSTNSSPIGAVPAFGVTSASAPSLNVAGSFSGGSNSNQFTNEHTDHFELQNFTTLTKGAQTIKFGTWMRDDRDALSNDSGFNGTFNFPSAEDFVQTANGNGFHANKLTYTYGPIAFQANVFSGALFVQDDWKVNKNLTLSGGLRWETQNHIADHSDWAPRVAFAYALDGHQKGAVSKTILRGGFGFFYDRFSVSHLMDVESLNGSLNPDNSPKSQVQIVIPNPQCFDIQSLNNIDGGNPLNLLAACGAGSTTSSVIYAISPTYRSPYMEQLGLSLERQLTKASTITLTYMHSSGFHQLVTRDANAYLPGEYQIDPNNPNGPPVINASINNGTRPNPNLGIVQQYFPEAVFNENQLIVNINARLSQKLSLFGFYTLSRANSDGGNGSKPSNSYNLMQDYGRASFVQPQWVFLMGNYTGPKGITFNPFLIAQAGRPYNISSPYDLTGDNFFNNRPSYAGPAANPANIAQTNFGALNVVPMNGEGLVPVSLGTSPSSVAVNLRIGRSFGIGPKVESTGGPPPGGGGPPGGGRRGPGGPFGGPFGGGRGGPFGGVANTGHKYSLNFNVQALNLFNDINRATPQGGIQQPGKNPLPGGLYGPGPEFGKSTGLAGGIFSTSSAARRVFLQLAFQF